MKPDIEIVGIARDTKYESMRDEMPIEVFYSFYEQNQLRQWDVGIYPHRAANLRRGCSRRSGRVVNANGLECSALPA